MMPNCSVVRGLVARKKFARAKAEAAREKALVDSMFTKVEKSISGTLPTILLLPTTITTTTPATTVTVTTTHMQTWSL